MDLSDEFLSLHVSPRSRLPLERAGSADLESLNERIRSGGVVDRGGRPVDAELAEGLIQAAEQVVFPIREGVLMLLWEDGIPSAVPAS